MIKNKNKASVDDKLLYFCGTKYWKYLFNNQQHKEATNTFNVPLSEEKKTINKNEQKNWGGELARYQQTLLPYEKKRREKGGEEGLGSG